MADEIHPTQPLTPYTGGDTPAKDRRRHKPKEQDEVKHEDSEDVQPKRPPKTGIIDEYV